MFEHSEQASPISEGVAEIQINITLQGINLNTWHMWATKATWVATFRDDYQRVEPGPPDPSAVFHMKTSTGSLWVPEHYPNVNREVQWGVDQLSDHQRY
jgi:hypothetical protein